MRDEVVAVVTAMLADAASAGRAAPFPRLPRARLRAPGAQLRMRDEGVKLVAADAADPRQKPFANGPSAADRNRQHDNTSVIAEGNMPGAGAPAAVSLPVAVAQRADVEREWAEYCLDPWSMFVRPLLADVAEPATAAYLWARETVEHLAPLATATGVTPSRVLEFTTAVQAMADAWLAADVNARSVGLNRMATDTKRALGQAKAALARALDERTGAAERDVCVRTIRRLLDGLVEVPVPLRERTVQQIERAHAALDAAAPS